MKVANYIAEFLVKNQIEDVFTVTGGGAMHLNDAFGHASGLRCIYNNHEQACAIASFKCIAPPPVTVKTSSI